MDALLCRFFVALDVRIVNFRFGACRCFRGLECVTELRTRVCVVFFNLFVQCELGAENVDVLHHISANCVPLDAGFSP